MGSHVAANLIATVQGLYAAVGDPEDDLERFFTEDLVILEAPDLPYGGRFVGPRALRELINYMNNVITAQNIVVERYAVGEGHVVASLRFDLVLRGGEFATQHVVEEFTFAGPLIREIRPYYFSSSEIRRVAKADAGAVEALSTWRPQ